MCFSKVLPYLFILSILTACSGQSAVKYNNMVVEMDSELKPAMESAESQIGKYAEIPQWDSVGAVSKRMEALVDTKLERITKKDPPDVAGADEFKREVIRYFKYIRDIYTSYGRLAAQSTEQARLKEYERFVEMVKSKRQVAEAFQAALQKFTRANNIRTEPNK